MTAELGRLEEADLRKVWKHEAENFTPWLADNLHYLSNLLDIQLKFVDKEVKISPEHGLKADIVAEGPSDAVVMIENQLEYADLYHLGQVLAYLAGLNAHIVIWVAKGFGEAHLSAIRWLNNHTSDPFAFFAIKVRAVRIGDSPVAPIFEVLEKPNEWDRQVRDVVIETVGSHIGQFRRKFWNHVAQKHPGVVKPDYAAAFVKHSVEGSELQISLYLTYHSVGIYLTTAKGVGTDAQDLSAPYLESLNETVMEHLPLGAFRSSETVGGGQTVYALTYLQIDSKDESNWDDMADWLHDAKAAYEDVLRNSSA